MPKQFDNKSVSVAEQQIQITKDIKKQKDWRLLEFFVPIEEAVQENNDFFIKGVAINETTTLNNVKYISEELEQAAPTFRNVPILLDHRNEVKNIVGRTTENVHWNSNFKRIEFEAKIMDRDIQERIKDGRIGSVSIGAKVGDLVEEEDGSMKAIGIRGLEISLVAVPGDSSATLAHALQHSFVLKEIAMQENYLPNSQSTKVDELNLKEDTMSEEEKKDFESPETSEDVADEASEETTESAETTEEPVEDSAEEEKEEEKEEVVSEEKAKPNKEIQELKKQIASIKELLVAKKQIKEKAMEEKKDNTKGLVSEKTEQDLKDIDNRIVEAVGGRAFAMYRDYAKESADTSLKRLVR